MASNSTEVQHTEVSGLTTDDEAVRSFQEHGFWYQNIPEIGQIFASLGPKAKTEDGFDKNFKDIIFRHQHLQQILEPYVRNHPAFVFSLGADPIRYFALTVDQNITKDHSIAVYLWSQGTDLECAAGSSEGEFTAVEWTNHMFHIPYPQIKQKFDEIRATMGGGGILIAHPRLAFIVKTGLSIGYVWPRSAAKD